MLQADNILAGNFFLRDWHLTGITFFTTDLVYFEFAKLFFVVSYRAIYVANGLKFLSIAVAAYYITIQGCCKDRNLKKGLLLLLASVPSMSYMIHSKVHAGVVCLTFLAFSVVYDILKGPGENDGKMLWKYAIFAVITAMGTLGDMLAVIEGTIPVLLFSLYRLLMQNGWKVRGVKYVKLAALTITGILADYILEMCMANFVANGQATVGNFVSPAAYDQRRIN